MSKKMVNRPARADGKVAIFRPWRTDPKTGRRIYPRNGRVFVFWVDPEDVDKQK